MATDTRFKFFPVAPRVVDLLRWLNERANDDDEGYEMQAAFENVGKRIVQETSSQERAGFEWHEA